MNAPPKIDPVTAHSDSDVVHWLTNDFRREFPSVSYAASRFGTEDQETKH
jgi:hypothetical protein